MTNRPRWILDFDPDFPASEQIARRLCDPVVVVPDAAGQYAWPEVTPPLVAYGTMRMVTRLRRNAALSSAVFDDYATLRCSSYYRGVYDLLGRTAVIVPLTALSHLDLVRLFGERVFVRPDSNFKLFAARVVACREVATFVQLEQVHRDELVVLSEVLDTIGPEYRCFCRAGRVVCSSSYPGQPYGPAPRDVCAFAEHAAARLAEFVPSPFVTVDVAVGPDRLRVVEVGGVNSWGIYGCDPGAFIAAMEAEALARYEEVTG